jgi:hypothetical protein
VLKKKTKKDYRFLKKLLRFFVGVLVFFLLILLFIRSPWGQQIIVQKAINYVTDKTNTKIEVDKVYLTFAGNLQIDNLYAEDKKGDTLVYSKSLNADLPLWKMINGEAFGVESLTSKDLVTNITRNDTISGYNFQFLIDAFASDSTTNAKPKDTVSDPIKIILKDLELQNANIVFNDAVIGIKSSYKIGELTGDTNRFDIDSMFYFASNLALKDSNIKIAMLSVPSSTNEKATPLPVISAESVLVENTYLNYNTVTETYVADVGVLYGEIPKIDIENFIYKIDAIKLSDSDINVAINTLTETAIKAEANKNKTVLLPNIVADIKSINLKNNSFSYVLNSAQPTENYFNPNAVFLKDFSLVANNITYKNKEANLAINSASFAEQSGFKLKQFILNVNLNETNFSANTIKITTNRSNIQGNITANYNSIDNLINQPEKTTISSNIPNYKISLRDFYVFNPALKKNQYINNLSQKAIYGHLYANGSLSEITIDDSKINWGNNTNLTVEGIIKNSTDIDNFSVQLPNFTMNSTRNDVNVLLNEQQFGIRYPNKLKLSGNASTSLTKVKVDLNLNTSQGDILLKGFFNSKKKIAYDLDLDVNQYNIGTLLQNPNYKTLSLTINSNGEGNSITNLNADLQGNISKFQLENYAIKNFEINGIVNNGKGNISSTYKDDNLNMSLSAFVNLDSINTIAKTNINIEGADLQALGIMQRNVKTGMEIDAEFNGNVSEYRVKSTISNGVFVYENRTYLLGNVAAKAFVNKDTTSVFLENRLLQLNLESNTDPQSFATSIQKHISSYFNKKKVNLDTIENPVNLKFKGKIAQAPLLNEVFLLNVKDLDTINLSVNFIEKERILDANITMPHINYMDYEVDSLSLNINTDHEDIQFDFGFNNIVAGPFNIPKTVVSGTQRNDSLALNLVAIDNNKKLLNIDTFINGSRDSLLFSIDNKTLLLNSKQWQIPENNKAIYSNKQLLFSEFDFNYNNQEVSFTSKLQNVAKNHIALTYKNFKLKEIFNYLNPDQQLIKGIVNGKVVLENPFTDTGIIADASINNLELVSTNFGTLSLKAKSLEGNHYDFSTEIEGGVTNLNLNGDYYVENNDANLNMKLDIKNFDIKALETLSLGEIKNANGQLNGGFSISGKLSEPQYRGTLNFLDAAFNIALLNTKFTLPNEQLTANNNGLQLNNFKVLDAQNNKLVVSGNVGTESFTNPTFNLKLNANDFKILNAKKEDNSDFYGNASFDASAKLTGDLNVPKLDAELTIGKGTDFYYVMPATHAGIEERDNVVVFVNRKNPDAILTQTEEQTAVVTGFDITAKLKTTKEATFTIIIDENTGDNFKVAGDTNLNMSINPNGDISLSGAFTADRGHYELNLYDLVNKKFSLVKGSKVSWSGDPFDAKLDVRALYEVETSASSLMSSRISGEDASVANQFRQQLPFFVYLSINGELMQPEISFTLDMPEDEKGALGGEVYARVQDVNNQEEELNKQVFSLLVLNRFYPTSGSDGSTGGFATVARNNLNDAVASQLNTFSNKVLGNSGVNLDFGLNSFTDYQGSSATERTQLEVAAEKKLFNDRFIVRVGSEIDVQGSNQNGEETPLIGNVSLIYQLTEDGRYQIKGFRTSEYENVIDGQTIVSGIAIVFNKEFNKFSQLWDSIFKAQNKQKQEDSKEKKLLKIQEKTKINY